MRYPKLREIKKAVSALLTRPYTTRFPYEEHIPFPSFRGKPYFHQEHCVGCAACVNVCPTGALSFKDVATDSGYKRILTVRWDICIECGQCELHCLTEKGIQLSNEFDISTTEDRKELYQTIEKELVLCEVCKSIVAPFDQIQWTIKKLGPLYVANTSLISFAQNIIGAKDEVPKEEREIFRADRFRILCARCRRDAVYVS